MKVGTDGVLLGAWTDLDKNPTSILDVGAGTGLIALMLAQRSTAETIDAIEIVDEAYEQCVKNFETSPWSDRLFCYHADVLEFSEEIDEQYDLIISNPPFHVENVSTGNVARDQARRNDSLPFEHLVRGVEGLLSRNGCFSIIIPFKEEKRFLGICSTWGLFPSRVTRVKGHPKAEIKRSLLQLSREEKTITTDEISIELDRHVYTQDYINLTKDFYLKM